MTAPAPTSRQSRAIRLLVVLVATAVLGASGGQARGASSSTVVSATVPSAISLTDGCAATSAWDLGVVLPGSTALTTTGASVCRMSFTSSNDSAQLRIAQRDGTGSAMSAANDLSATQSPGFMHSMLLTGRAYDANLAYFGGLSNLVRWNGATWTNYPSVSPTGNTINGLDFEPGQPSIWWAVGNEGVVLRSTNANGGAPTWSQTPMTTLQAAGWPAARAVNAVEVVSSTLTFVVGGDGWVARTTNNGATAGGWTLYQLTGTGPGHSLPSIAVDPGNPNKLVILDPYNGASLFYTTTGGANAAAWTEVFPPQARYFLSVTASDSTHWYAAGYDGGIFTSPDGINWTLRDQRDGYFGTYNQVTSHPSAPATAYVAGDAGQILRTTDGGVTWTRQQVPSGGTIQGIAAGSPSTVFAGGVGNTALRSTDADTSGTWTEVHQDAGAFSLRAMQPSPGDGRTIVGVGGEGLIRRTTDGGTAWSNIASGASDPLYSISWGSGTTAWIVGDGGRILRSTDSGASWSTQPSGVTVRLVAVAAVDTSTAYAVGELGTVLRTTNGGTTWVSLTSGTTRTLHGVTATEAGIVVAVGNRSTVIRSTDGGATFATLPTGGLPHSSADILGIDQGRGATMYISTTWRGAWRSLDAGATWSALPADLLFGSSVFGMSSLGDTIVITGSGGQVEVSRDGGDTWSMTNVGSTTWGDMHLPAILGSNRIMVPSDFSGYVRLVPSVTNTVADYGGGATWGNPVATTNLFGVCLQATGGSTAAGAGWSVDGNGTCTASDADPWHAIPVLAEPLATTAAAGAPGQVDLVWGLRTSQSQPPGMLRATIAFEAIAPDV